MKERVSDKFWFPFWVDKWIFGSMRIECTLEERAIWVDLLALASKDDGYIRANEETPYPIKQLAGMLMIPEKTLSNAIEKFIKLKDKTEGKGKLTRTKYETLYITKWEKYQFSESYERVKKHRKKTETNGVGNGKKLHSNGKTLLYNNIEQNNKGKNKIEYNFDDKEFHNITKEDKELWNKAYPACDIDMELLKMSDWLLSNPDKRKTQYRRFITNWLSRTQDKGGTKLTRDEKRKKELEDWAKEKPREEEK